MYAHQIESAREFFSKIALFECCYVRGDRATYAVHDSKNGDFYRPVFYRTVSILTGEIIDEAFYFPNHEYCHSFGLALKYHYSPEYIRNDGLALMYEQLREIDAHKTHMHYHTVFGQSVFYADLDELRVSETEVI